MTVQKICTEMEILLSDMGFTGIRNVQPVLLRKMENMKAGLLELSMNEGAKQIDDFLLSIRAYHTHSLSIGTVVDKLCALDFYVKTVLGNIHSNT